MIERAAVVVPWVTEKERDEFLRAWKAEGSEPWLILQQDKHKDGCGVTKNNGIANAVKCGFDIVVILDGDCYPHADGPRSLETMMEKHVAALEPQPVDLFEVVTSPPSRGTPYSELSVNIPVAASMGFWSEVGDYCGVRQLAHNCAPMSYTRKTVSGRYFPLCGMNLAFRPKMWWPWCKFIDVSRFDDIWMGWLFQKEAYRRGYCFNLGGPLVRHSRQSNVWKNLKDEALYLKENETLWREIAASNSVEYDELVGLLPAGVGGKA